MLFSSGGLFNNFCSLMAADFIYADFNNHWHRYWKSEKTIVCIIIVNAAKGNSNPRFSHQNHRQHNMTSFATSPLTLKHTLNDFICFISGTQTSMNDSCESPCSSSSSSCPPLLTPTGSRPDVVGMFDMDPPDSLPSPSDQTNFDPMRHTFSEEELKPQPMIKKARKIQVPDNMKVSVFAC